MRQKTDRRTRGEAGDQMPASRVNLYDEVTAKIIAELEGGRIPWVQPWGTPNGQGAAAAPGLPRNAVRSEEHTSELQSLMRISYAVFCLKKKKQITDRITDSMTNTKELIPLQ